MHAAMDVAVVALIVLPDGINDLAGLLRRSSIIEVYQGTFVYLLLKDREVSSYLFNIKIHVFGLNHKSTKVTGDGVEKIFVVLMPVSTTPKPT
jgi:hypothetical protein